MACVGEFGPNNHCCVVRGGFLMSLKQKNHNRMSKENLMNNVNLMSRASDRILRYLIREPGYILA